MSVQVTGEQRTNASVRVRAARIWDWVRLRGLMNQLFPHIDDATLGLWLRDQRHCLAVALVGGQLAGLVRLEVLPGRRVTRLALLGVTASLRGQGVARAMLAYCDEVACACGAPDLELDVAAQDVDSQAFFDHVGFATTKRRGCVSLQESNDAADSGYGSFDPRDAKRLSRHVSMPLWPSWQLKREHAPRVPPTPYQRMVMRALYGAWVGSARAG